MAIYHLNIKGCSPATGPNAVKKAAYQSGQTLIDEATGEVCDYPRKERIVDTGLALPDGAPELTRQELWNRADAQWLEDGGGKALVLTRIEGALPRELSSAEQRQLVLDMCAKYTAEGKACDWAIHLDEDGINPHFHILVSALKLKPDGHFEPRKPKDGTGQTYYLCRNDRGETLFVSALDWKRAKTDGWQKVYNFKDGERRTMKQAKAEGLGTKDRTSKQPVQMHRKEGEDGRTESAWRVGAAEMKQLRADWAALANAAIDRHNAETGESVQHIDHRSNKERGLKTEPTIHEGGRGLIGYEERVEWNRRVKERNAAILKLAAALEQGERQLAALQTEIEQLKKQANTAEHAWERNAPRAKSKRKGAVARQRRAAMSTAAAKAQAKKFTAKNTAVTDTARELERQLRAQIADIQQEQHELQHAVVPNMQNVERATELGAELKRLTDQLNALSDPTPTTSKGAGKPHGDRANHHRHDGDGPHGPKH